MANDANESVLKKIRDLLNLADDAGATDAEGETAARMAQLLMSKHGIAEEAARQAAVRAGHTPRKAPIDSEQHGSWRSRPTWVGVLAMAVAEHNGCYVYWDSVWNPDAARYTYALRFCGVEADRQLTLALFSLLRAQVDRSTRRHATGKGRTWGNNFRLGMVGRLRERLNEARKQAEAEARKESGDGASLVLVTLAITARRESVHLARQWIRAQGVGLRRGSSARSRRDVEARAQGRAEGNKATLGHDRMGGE